MKVRLGPSGKERREAEIVSQLAESYRCRGRIRAEGKKAKPLFCFRPRTEGKGQERQTVLELHSKVTGKQIGWLGSGGELVKTRAQADSWNYLSATLAPGAFRTFLYGTRSKNKNNPWVKRSKEALKEMEREARK